MEEGVQMAATLDTILRLVLNANLANVQDLGQSSFPVNKTYTLHMPTGTASGKADKIFTDQRAIAGSGVDTLDLAAVLVDPLGAVLTFAKVKLIVVKAADANPNNIIISPDDTAGFLGPFGTVDDDYTLKPGGLWVCVEPLAGFTVTATTADKLTLTNAAAGTVNYDIFIVGTSA